MMHISKSLRTRAIEIQLSRCYPGHLNGEWGSKLLVYIGSLWPWELGVLDFQTNPYLSIVQSYFFAGTCKYRYTNTMMVCAIWKKHNKSAMWESPKNWAPPKTKMFLEPAKFRNIVLYTACLYTNSPFMDSDESPTYMCIYIYVQHIYIVYVI